MIGAALGHKQELGWSRDAKLGLKAYLDIWYNDNIHNLPGISALHPMPTTKPKITKYEPGHHGGWIKSKWAFLQKAGGKIKKYFAVGPQTRQPYPAVVKPQGKVSSVIMSCS